ncbi:MAG: carboxypeptidase-like regulatory domain-containing protein, partial [Prevotella sp.]|nr:carboxypeptidase-like regulatory domain-containing protein [Prevotella sp.]
MSGKFKIFRLALLFALAMLAGNISAQTIKGTVTDTSGEPVIGATVMETGTQNGVVTDIDGNFTLQNVKGKTITISYIGMKTQTVNLDGK